MIVRVLRPVTGSKGRAGTPGEETAPKLEPLVDEAADANAIEVSYSVIKSGSFQESFSKLHAIILIEKAVLKANQAAK